MIAKKIPMRNVRLSSFADLVTYLSSSQGIHNRVGKIALHNFQVENIDFAVQDVLRVQDYNKTTKADKTYHLLVSFANGENLSDEQLAQIEQSMVEALGYGEHQRISVVHRDTDNLHFHVAINKIHPQKKTVHEPYRDFKVLGEQCRKFEIALGLQRVERGRGNRTGIDMEEMSGLESLLGWIRRNVADGLREAQSWEQLHQMVLENGLELKQRGNGLVLGAGEVWVKASSVDRELSKAKLEQKLGAYRPPPVDLAVSPVKAQYEKKPYSRTDTSRLYATYQAERSKTEHRRREQLEDLLYERDRDIRSIKSKYDFRIRLAKLGGRRNRTVLRILSSQRRLELQSRRSQYRWQCQAVYQQHKQQTWADWLQQQAAAGNAEALQALRDRGKQAVYRGNQFQGREEGSGLAAMRVDTVTKKGTVVYEQDGYTIRDAGQTLHLADVPADPAVEKALRLAMAKYGRRLKVEGTQDFRQKVARIAAAADLDVEFTDPLLEQSFQQYKRRYIDVRTRTRSGLRAIDGVRGRDGIGSVDGAAGVEGDRIVFGERNDVRSRNGRVDGAVRTGAHTQLDDPGRVGVGAAPSSAEGSDGLRGVSERRLVRDPGRTQMLLSGHVSGHLEQSRAADHPAVRRAIHRTGSRLTAADVFQAVVGLVAKPGSKPPAFRRGYLQGLSALRSLFSPRPAVTFVPAQQVADPVQQYINEREEKRQKGFDIVHHRRYNATDAGRLIFNGIREVGGHPVGLFKLAHRDEVVVLGLSDYARRRLAKLKLGSEVTISKAGQVRISKGRNR